MDLRERLMIPQKKVEEINRFLMDPDNKLINELLQVVEKYGGVEEINRKAKEAGTMLDIKPISKIRSNAAPI